ncbi:MAG: alcohol dehydrogenase [Alphaproteobacteria bacterium]|nr:alcohol dehydrogenase [Alphaproteobacteria bacterium]
MLKGERDVKSRVMVQVADRRLEMRSLEVPPVGPAEGLLKVEGCGLCGSDIEQFRGHFTAKGIVTYPLIPGHEPVGTLVEVGPQAASAWGVKAGDRVALEPHLSCGLCRTCLSGGYHLCRAVRPVGLPSYGFLPLDFGHGLWGGYSEFIHLHPRTVMHKLPLGMPVALATIYQALAAGIRWAVQVPRTALGDTVLILGCGQRGLGSVVAAKEAGAGCIIVTGLAADAHKLALARSLGAHHTIVADQEDVVARVMAITHGAGADVAVDVVPAAPQPVIHAVEAVRVGGTIVIAGVKGRDTRVSLDTDRVLFKEITIHGVYSQGRAAYEQSLRLLAENTHGLERLHTHEFPLEKAAEALMTLGGEIAGREAICVSLHP